MLGDRKLRERYVQAYLHDARPMSVILKELGGARRLRRRCGARLRALAVASAVGA